MLKFGSVKYLYEEKIIFCIWNMYFVWSVVFIFIITIYEKHNNHKKYLLMVGRWGPFLNFDIQGSWLQTQEVNIV